ncbi:MAG TPA: hypothetical protein VN397_02090 [Candidatus Methylomirabilis sp.]|nr:hypothetical protein [Candidatus Methylomirabilis sp.]
MKHRLIFSLAALAICSLPIAAGAATAAPTMAERLQGYILLQVESHGEAWYVRSKDLKRYYMKDGAAAYSIMRFFSQGITDADLAKIPQVSNTAEMKASSSVCTSNALANRLRGLILLQVQQHGEAWYVDPVKCRAIYMKDGAVAYEVMRFLGLGILTSDLKEIEDGGAVAGSSSNAPSSSSCPTNSHQDPSDASKCLCDSGYQTNSAGNGCAVASSPPPPSWTCPTNSHQDPSDVSKCLCDSGYQTNSAKDGCAVAEIFDVKVNSLTCNRYNVEPSQSTRIRANMNGTAQGPVGAEIRVPILLFIDDKVDCGAWTYGGAYARAYGGRFMYEICTRKEGQPETTTWSVDTGGEEVGEWLSGTKLSKTVGIYKDRFDSDPLYQEEESWSVVCP